MSKSFSMNFNAKLKTRTTLVANVALFTMVLNLHSGMDGSVSFIETSA